MQLKHEEWTLDHLHAHLQAAVDLEFWTIPFYMSAMYSLKERDIPDYQLIRTVLNQEMLHLQSAANIANAYGLSPTFEPPVYEGDKVPHLDFSLDNPEVVKEYEPYTAEIGPLDEKHINAMCLIELPDYESGESEVRLHDSVGEYGTIGAFYAALRKGCELLQGHIRGGVRQVDLFSAFYRNTPNMTVTESGAAGFPQVGLLIDLITEQGEGQAKKKPVVPPVFQNTADDTQPADDHFAKFNQIKKAAADAEDFPPTYEADPVSEYTDEQKYIEDILLKQFGELRALLRGLFSGENPDNFFPIMASVGGAIRNCWKHKVTPRYSGPSQM